MVFTENIPQSTKRLGKREEGLILRLTRHFLDKGYEAVPHSRLNIAWGSILSDIDLLLLKDHTLTYIEVKSSRDNIARARRQTDRVMDYIDYAYLATDRKIRDWTDPNIGLIYVQEDTVSLVRKAKKFSEEPRFSSIIALRKKCLTRFFGNDSQCLMFFNKYELAHYVYAAKGKKCTRECLKEVVTCGELCDARCPILQIA